MNGKRKAKCKKLNIDCGCVSSLSAAPAPARPPCRVKTGVLSFAFWRAVGGEGGRQTDSGGGGRGGSHLLPSCLLAGAACLSAPLVCMQNHAGCPLFAPDSPALPPPTPPSPSLICPTASSCLFTKPTPPPLPPTTSSPLLSSLQL